MKFLLTISIITITYANTLSAQSGNLDSTFGVNGISITHVNTDKLSKGNYSPNVTALQPDGKIIVGEIINNAEGNNFIMVRYRENGELDNSFGKKV